MRKYYLFLMLLGILSHGNSAWAACPSSPSDPLYNVNQYMIAEDCTTNNTDGPYQSASSYQSLHPIFLKRIANDPLAQNDSDRYGELYFSKAAMQSIPIGPSRQPGRVYDTNVSEYNSTRVQNHPKGKLYVTNAPGELKTLFGDIAKKIKLKLVE